MIRHLRIINLILCALCVSAVMSCATPSKSPTWLTGFRYRVLITVQETSGSALTNYQIKIDIQGVTPQEPNCVDFSRIQPGGNDIRFTDSQHRLINFWIKSWDNKNKTATIWIKAPELQAGLRNTIYMYYGMTDFGFRPPAGRAGISDFGFDKTMTKLIADSKTCGLWHMDKEGKRINDSSRYQNHSQILKATWLGKDGGQLGTEPDYNFSKGNAPSFDGITNHIEIPNNPSLDFTDRDEISIEAWISPITCGNYTPIISKPGNYSLYIMSDGRLCCYLYGPKPEDYYYSKTPLSFGSWSHIALTYNGEKLRFYINGKLDSEFALAGKFKPCLDRIHNIEYQKSPLYFAYDPLSPETKYWKGTLDEVRILSRALSDGEIKTDYERRTDARSEPRITIGEEETAR